MELRLETFEDKANVVSGYAQLTVDQYEKLNRCGEGTYGIVYKTKCRKTGGIFALKKIRMNNENEGLPISSLREISLLKQLTHKNIVQVVDVVVGSKLDDIFMVMEYCEQDMAYLIDNMTNNEKYFRPSEVKCLLSQLLHGVEYLHENYIIHRDLKMSNLLLTSTGILKIADFGLARKFSVPVQPMTPKVVTLWYRSIELLFGEKVYTKKVDLWSVGCIFAEWILGKPLMAGKVESELIIDLLGAPNEKIWPGFLDLPYAKLINLPDQPYNTLKKRFDRPITPKAIALLENFLTFDPKERINVSEALKDPYFLEHPRACFPDLLPTFPEFRISSRKTSEKVDEEVYSSLHEEKRRKIMKVNETVLNDESIGAPIVNRFGDIFC